MNTKRQALHALTLRLLMGFFLTLNEYSTLTANHLTLLTALLHRRSNYHVVTPQLFVSQQIRPYTTVCFLRQTDLFTLAGPSSSVTHTDMTSNEFEPVASYP